MTRDPHALIDYLEDREDWAFGYSPDPKTHDCVRFCAGGVEAVTGHNPLARINSRWTTRRGARRVLATYGGLAEAVASVMTTISPTLAQRGDVGLTDEHILVLVEGDMVVGLHPERGYVRQPRSAMTWAWSV